MSGADNCADTAVTFIANQAFAPFSHQSGNFFVEFAGGFTCRALCASRLGSRSHFTLRGLPIPHDLQVLQFCRARVGSLDQHEDTGTVPGAIIEKRLHAVAAEERVHGEGVGAIAVDLAVETLRAADKSGRISGGGDADVASLGVGDDDKPGGGGALAEVLEGLDTRRPVLFKAGELQFDSGRVRRHGVDDGGAELLEAGAYLVTATTVTLALAAAVTISGRTAVALH